MSDANNVSRRRFLQATGSAAGAVALAGCPNGNETPTTTDETEINTTATQTETNDGINKGGQLELINTTISTLDPIKANDPASEQIIQQLFDGLMTFPEGRTAVEPQLAEAFDANDDFTTYTFTLKDATFHNGDPVRAQDFVYSWERLAASPNSNLSSYILNHLGIVHNTDSDGNYAPGSLAVTAEDETTLTFELERPFASTLSMLAYVAFAAIPEGIVGDIDGYDGEMEHSVFATQNPIGAGPFKFDAWNQSENARVVKYDEYHDEPAYLDAIHWAVIESADRYYQYIEDQNADIFEIPISHFDPELGSIETTDEIGRGIGTYGPLENDETVSYARVPRLSTYYIAFNANNVPKSVRQAVAYAINQEDLATTVFTGRAVPAYHLTPPLIYPGNKAAYDMHAEEHYPYGYNESSIESARDIMENAGYDEDNQYELTLTHAVNASWNQMAEILRGRLNSAHIEVSIDSVVYSDLQERGRNGNLMAYVLGRIAEWPAPDNFLQDIYPPRTDTSSPGTMTYTNWDDQDTEAKQAAASAFETIMDTPQPTDEANETRNDAYIAMEEANWDDAIVIPTFHSVSEPMHYNWVHTPIPGSMGSSYLMHHRTWKTENAPTTPTTTD